MFVSARSFAEYRAMFGLTDEDLLRSILDCPAGAAAFTAAVPDGTAVDPQYAHRDTLGNLAVREARHKHDDLVRDADQFRWSHFRDPADCTASRVAAATIFGADIVARPERYVTASLPDLPFADKSFDLTLCSHLLFCYGATLDVDFHLASLLELIRVTRTEVRLYPLVHHTTNIAYGPLGDLRSTLAEHGVPSTIVPVDYQFQPGADAMLVLDGRRHGPLPAAPTSSSHDPVRWRHRGAGSIG